METHSSDRRDAPKRSLLRLSPSESLVALGIATGVFGLWIIQFENLNFLSLTVVVLLFLMGILLRSCWAVYLLIATLLFLKFVISPQISETRIGGFDLLFSCVAMAFAGLCFRYLELSKFTRAFYPAANKSTPPSGSSEYQFPSLLGGRWWLIPVAVFLATVLLWAFPYDAGTSRRYWITPTGTRMIFMTFFLFFFWFVCRSVLAFAMRWQMEPAQADVQVRSMIADELWNEQSPIEAKRLKFRMRRDRR